MATPQRQASILLAEDHSYISLHPEEALAALAYAFLFDPIERVYGQQGISAFGLANSALFGGVY